MPPAGALLSARLLSLPPVTNAHRHPPLDTARCCQPQVLIRRPRLQRPSSTEVERSRPQVSATLPDRAAAAPARPTQLTRQSRRHLHRNDDNPAGLPRLPTEAHLARTPTHLPTHTAQAAVRNLVVQPPGLEPGRWPVPGSLLRPRRTSREEKKRRRRGKEGPSRERALFGMERTEKVGGEGENQRVERAGLYVSAFSAFT